MKAHHWIILLIVIAVSALLIWNKTDIDPRVDQRIDLNWKFTLEDDPGFSKTDFDDSSWEIVSLPHDWMITLEPEKDNPSGTAGGFYPGGVGWYRKQLDISEYKSREQFYLVFDGVFMNASVWINGNFVGAHNYGYIGFDFDISEYVRKDTVNIIAVRTDCSKMPADRWYSGAGIYRHVRLIATDPLHFPVLNTSITTSSNGEERIARSNFEVLNNDRHSRRFSIRSELLAPDGSLVESSIVSETIDGRSNLLVSSDHLISDPQLWSDKNPALF